MELNTKKLKITLGITYLALISIGLFFLFSMIDLSDLTSYEFIRTNKDIILKYKNENFIFLTIIFFIFGIVWVLLLGFATPLLIFGGFVPRVLSKENVEGGFPRTNGEAQSFIRLLTFNFIFIIY